MSLSASCVWRVQADLVLALDAQLGPPVDSYVNGTQTWLTEDGPGGVALEWRLHPVAEYRVPTGVPVWPTLPANSSWSSGKALFPFHVVTTGIRHASASASTSALA